MKSFYIYLSTITNIVLLGKTIHVLKCLFLLTGYSWLSSKNDKIYINLFANVTQLNCLILFLFIMFQKSICFAVKSPICKYLTFQISLEMFKLIY